jgi:poly [ADP-ribose] polymerase 10/14/15
MPSPPTVIDNKRIAKLITSRLFPLYWSPQEIEEAQKNNGLKIELKKSDPEFQLTTNMIHESSPKSKILRIYKVINPVQYIHYLNWCEVLKFKYPHLPSINEMYAFHGTTEDSVNGIVKFGFKYRFNSRCIYGKGNYFAKNASYSIDSSYSRPNKAGEKFLFVCRVCVGQTKLGDSEMTCGDDTFQTATDHTNPKKQEIFVTFDDHQSLPEFLVVLK